MSYREPARATPLIWTLSQHVFALDPDSGRKLWELELRHSPERTFLFEEALFVTSKDELLVIDIRSGELVETRDLGFHVSAVLVEEHRVLLAGGHGMACMGPGRRVLWSVTEEQEKEGGFFAGTTTSLVARSDSGMEMWKSQPGMWRANGGLILGDQIVQPDLDRDT